MTAAQIAIAFAIYMAPCIISFILWRRLTEARKRLETIRQLALDNITYRPDDLIDRPAGKTFERASSYWSGMILLVLAQKT